MHTASMGRARLSPTPGLTFGLIGEGTNGLGSISSEPGKGVCVHWFIVAGTSRSISATSAPISRLAYSVDLRDCNDRIFWKVKRALFKKRALSREKSPKIS